MSGSRSRTTSFERSAGTAAARGALLLVVAIVLGIVNSTPFQKRTKVTQEIENPAVRTAER